MQPLDLFQVFTGPLEALGVPYFVTGSVASLVYGEPRLTHDIDLVLSLRDLDAERLVAAFPTEDFYCPPVEVIRVERRRSSHGHFNLIDHASGFKADIYLHGQNPLHAWAFARRRRAGPPGKQFWLAPPEYVVIRKLEFFREGGAEKHVRDVRAMLAALGDDVDRGQIETWVTERGLASAWARVTAD